MSADVVAQLTARLGALPDARTDSDVLGAWLAMRPGIEAARSAMVVAMAASPAPGEVRDAWITAEGDVVRLVLGALAPAGTAHARLMAELSGANHAEFRTALVAAGTPLFERLPPAPSPTSPLSSGDPSRPRRTRSPRKEPPAKAKAEIDGEIVLFDDDDNHEHS